MAKADIAAAEGEIQ
ncbi:protein of unknown function [Candidatus Filomicrobium marinum]|uniref:Uncharacterized protein n=1 Tax=Candidatus Filomicrobium marinum TaxID=1608628 RepID=A0A0D6JL21_9HYPH|nr:protein of unknown function [Candidatus Filomicrobium marinum]CPR22355.1 protein of unknown function [Candidatus Filomicrobium marinum]